MVKKIIKENAEQVDETTAAASSLSAGSMPTPNPKSKLEAMSAIINVAQAKSGEDLTKWYTQMIGQIGHEADGLPAGATKEHNQGTIKTHGEDVVNALKSAITEDLSKIFEGTELSEEFVSRTSTLFEAALNARVNVEIARLEEENEVRFEEELNEAVEALVERLDNYVDYTANKWIEENEVAIESTLRNEISSDLMTGLANVFKENNINIPEEQVDVVDQLAQTVEESETRINEMLSEIAELRLQVEEFERDQVLETVSEGLTVVEKSKLREMASAIDTTDLEDFTTKVEVIKESTFVTGTKKPSTLTEQLEEVNEDNKPEATKTYSSPQMRSYVDAIKRTARG